MVFDGPVIVSHTPLLKSGLVIKRKLNCIRPTISGGPVPPSGLVFFFAETPAPAETVTGPAADERALFDSYLTAIAPETFEAFENGESIGDAPLSSNGNALHIAAASVPEARNNNLGRFNTTPGGAVFAQNFNALDFDIVFDDLVAGFGAYFTDMGDFDAEWFATIYDQFNVPTVVPIGNSVGVINGSLIFWGWLDNSGLLYSRVVFSQVNYTSPDGIGVDDIITPSLAQINF